MFPPPPRNERYLAAARVARGGVLCAPGGRVRLVYFILNSDGPYSNSRSLLKTPGVKHVSSVGMTVARNDGPCEYIK
eukprot:1196119-Prorocentrum_minimum.AAC.4